MAEEEIEEGTTQEPGPIRESKLSIKNKYFDMYGPVFWPSALIASIFIAVSLIFNEQMASVFSTVQTSISNNFGWMFVLAVNIFLVFAIVVAFSKYGKIKLGGPKAKPEFSTFSWFAMLFSAGMGIGILFWSVGEPVYHFISPPEGEGGTVMAAEQAMTYTFLHWGLHAWAIYAIVAMALAFFTYNRGLPLTIRSVFKPLLGDKINGIFGDIIDVLAVVATLFGLATSLGFGVQQVSAGLNHLFDLPDTITTQVLLIIGITMAATVSVVTGVDKGVRILSEFNIRTAAAFLVLVIILGPTLFIFDSFTQNTGNYMQELLKMSFWTESYQGSDWQNSWTVFYWAWWISWSPFVGTFIARVSKGRSIKEFVLGVLLVPTLLTFLWLSTFGGTALYQELNGIGNITAAVQDNVATALFVMVEQLPFSFYINIVAVILIIGFFITSSDSGSLVVDSLTSGGKLDAPKGQRIFWANMEGLVAAVLLIGGGLGALQTAAITTGLPFTIILCVMCVSLIKGFEEEHQMMMNKKADKERESYKEMIKHMVERRRQGQKANTKEN